MAVAGVVNMPNSQRFRNVPPDEGRSIVMEAMWVSKTGVEGVVRLLMGTGNVNKVAFLAGVGTELVKVEVAEATSETMAVKLGVGPVRVNALIEE
jgi:hypothetical protein